MGNVSRPLIALLVGTVAFFAVWMLALKPSSSTNSSSSGVGSLQPAIDKAHGAVALSNAVSAAHGADPGSTAVATPVASPRPAVSSSHATPVSPTVKSSSRPTARTVGHARGKPHLVVRSAPSPAARLGAVTHALATREVLALLFYNPAAADDRAVKRELASVPLRRHAVLALEIPIDELAGYPVVTSQVGVSQTPTLVLIDGRRQATEIVGFADTFEISQRITDALSAR